MQEYVKDAIITNEFRDLVLIRLVELTIYSIQADKPLYINPLDEPAFYRKQFNLWVREALEEKKALEQAERFDPFSEENGA
jgi:hypothetical protein